MKDIVDQTLLGINILNFFWKKTVLKKLPRPHSFEKWLFLGFFFI
jgi:hypothetical protein